MKQILLIIFLYTSIFAQDLISKHMYEFELPDLYTPTDVISNSTLEGKVVLLNIWASWCGGCKDEMPLFVELQKRYYAEDFIILLASIDKDKQKAIDFLSEVDKNRILMSIYDEGKTLPKTYKCIGMPSSYLINKNGEIVEEFVGSLDEDKIKNLKTKIDSLIGE